MSDEGIDEAIEALEDMTPEALAGHIRDLVADSRKSAHHRKRALQDGDLQALASWERELTSNYGVER